jgi:D-alanyl-D-alanine carboxypeptidase/D-alanyl-D-alanine-endopeptidase (penicillin-binding protein 4)
VSLRAAAGRPPASVEKLYTSAALLRSMGTGARLRTTVLGNGSLAGDTWRGNLYLRGGGDPTFGAPVFNRRWLGTDAASVSDLVSQLQARGIRRVTGSLIGDGSMFDGARGGPTTRFAPNIADLGGQLSGLTFNHGAAGRVGWDPAGFASQQLALTLHAAHIATGPAGATGQTPRGAKRLATVSSPPMAALLRLMNVPSDDFFAEMLTKQLGARFAGSGSTPAGMRVISHDLGAFGIHPKVVDGSGLSRDDNSSPRDVVRLLRAVWRTPAGDALASSLPSVGVNGTVRRIAAKGPAKGQCVAKTGTLLGVTNLAGYCHSAGRQLLAFAVFLDGPSNYAGIQVLGRVVTDMVGVDVARR